ncbi:hypothetical protein JCM10450v2_004445 [Rhodotorula kratochvilovae]
MSGGINPALLTLNNTGADEEMETAAAGADDAEGPEEAFYTVETILDYKLYDQGEYMHPSQFDPKKRFEIRYFVKWLGYDDPSENTWEPRGSFAHWAASYDEQIRAVQRAHPGKPSPQEVRAEAKRKNAEMRQRIEDAKKGITGAALLQGRKRKGKGRAGEAKEAKVKKEVKPTQKRKVSNGSRESSVASTSHASASAAAAASRRRTTRTSAAEEYDPAAVAEFYATNAPREMRKLRVTPPPERDANGELIVSSDDEGEGESEEPASPQVDAQQLHADAGADAGLGFADDEDEDVGMEDYGAQSYGAAQAMAPAPAAANGWGGSDDEDMGAAAAPPAPAPTGSAPGGFADPDDEDHDGAYFPSLVPGQASQTISVGAHSHQPTPQPAQPVADGGFAGPSDDEHDEAQLAPGAADAAMDNVPISAGVSASGDGSERGALAQAPQGFAEDDGEDEPMQQAQTAPQPVPGSFAGSEEDEPQTRTAGCAGGEDEKERAVAAQPAAQPVASGFADDDYDDYDDYYDEEDAALAAAVPPAAAPSAPAPAPALALGGFPDSDDSEPDIPLAMIQQRSREASVQQRSREASMQPPKKPVSKSKEQVAPPPPPPMRPQKRPSQDDSSSAIPKESKAAKINKVVARKDVRAASPEEFPRPAARKRASRDAQPPKKRKKLVIADDEEEEERDMSPPMLTQAQALARLKIPKVGQQRPAAAAASPAGASGSDRSRQSPSISNETSSLGSGAQAQKVLDPFNQGVVRPTVSNGYIRLNADSLSRQRLPAALMRKENVRYPPDVVSDVDKIRFLWSIGPGSNPFNGVEDFDDQMHYENEPHEAYITDPPDEAKAGRDKRARAHLNEYRALQLVLTSIPGVKQAAAPRESVNAVFVHVSELGQIGRFPGAHQQLEQFRRREDVVFFVYGEAEDRKRALHQFWRSVTAFTFTPEVFKKDPERISALVLQAANAYNQVGIREQFPWVPLQHLLPGGAFGPVNPEVVGKDPLRVEAEVELWALILQGQLPVATVAARSSTALKSFAFPDRFDRAGRNPSAWSAIAEAYPREFCDLDLEKLQKLVCNWRAEYPQIRRWVVIATEEELAQCGALPGIHLMPLNTAERLLRPHGVDVPM